MSRRAFQPLTRALNPNARSLSLLFNRKPVVSVLPLHGAILAPNGMSGANRKSLNMGSLQKSIEKAFKPKRLHSVLLSVNSPGGSAAQSELIADFIRQKADERKVPVIAFAEDMALSGGYWLACAGEKIFVTKSSIVGSIGVISAGFGLDKVIDKWGVERRVRTAGKSKSMLDPFVPEKEEDVKVLTAMLEAVHENFKEHVRSSRGSRLRSDEETLFNGAFWVGQTAVDHGLVDGIANINSHIADTFGSAKDVKVVRLSKGGSLGALFGAEAPSVDLREMLLHAAQSERFQLK